MLEEPLSLLLPLPKGREGRVGSDKNVRRWMTTFFCLCRCHNGSECGECGECDECGECAEDCNDAGGERDGDRMESYAELE